ncbi:MAG: SEC14 family lipid-binding protein [archaeon]|nr:SEC14 family lipid-binding protein [archaeon]
MGAECVSKDSNMMTEAEENSKNDPNNIIIEYNFNFKNYKEYLSMIHILKEKVKEILGKISSLSHFECPKRTKPESEFEFFDYLQTAKTDALCTSALSIYQKIGAIYGENMPFPKEELSKITFGLIAKYQAYESEEEEFTGKFVIDKIIRRINFFTEEFPYKLKNLENIILSKRIYVFGYDTNLRLNIFIEPEIMKKKIQSRSHPKTKVYKDRCNPELKEEFFYFEDKKEIPKEKIKINNADYLTYIYFILEIVLPILNERFNFSSLINLIINFDGNEADTEMITYLMTNFNNYYPFGLGKVHIVNFQVEKLIPNKSFRDQVGQFDLFRNLIFHNESFQFQLVKDTNINILPIKYGGYHSLEGYSFPNNPNLNDYINYTLSMILIN